MRTLLATGLATAALMLAGCSTYGYPGYGYPSSSSNPSGQYGSGQYGQYGQNGPYGSPYGGGGQYGEGGVVRCESNDGRYRQCAINTNGGVQLVRTLSSAACIEGRSWGSNRAGVWVSQGCRAEFRSGGGYYGSQGHQGSSGNGYGNGQLIRCESNDERTQRCAVDTRGGVQLVNKLSSSDCIQGRSWSYDRNGIWVSDGCRAEFAVGTGGNGYGSGGYGNSGYGNNYGIGGQVFRCESNDNRRRECAANTRAGVQLVRQLSSSPCIQGRSWGYGRTGVWVSEGCRAEFRSY